MFGMQIATAHGHFFAGRYDEALLWADSAVREQPNFFVGLCVAAAGGALAGRQAEAEKAMARLRELEIRDLGSQISGTCCQSGDRRISSDGRRECEKPACRTECRIVRSCGYIEHFFLVRMPIGVAALSG